MENPSPFRFGARKKKTVKYGDGPSRLYTVVIWGIAAALGVAGCTAATSPALLSSLVTPPAISPARVTAIAATPLDEALRITVDATHEMQYTAVKLSQPPRLVIDIADTELAPELQPLVLTEELALGVEPRALPDQAGVRLVVPLRQAVNHVVSAE